MQISWDPKKDEEHIEKRGIGFKKVAKLLLGDHVTMPNPGYPGQVKAVGRLDNKYWTLVIELHQDDLGELIWCSNFWESTKEEKEYGRLRGLL